MRLMLKRQGKIPIGKEIVEAKQPVLSIPRILIHQNILLSSFHPREFVAAAI